MGAKKNTATETTLQFVFAWVEHPVLGDLVDAFAVHQLKSGHFSYEFYRLTQATVADYFPEATPAHLSILKQIEQFSEDALQRKFKPARQKSRSYLESLEPEFVEVHIRPFIEKRIYDIALLMQQHHFPLYYKGQKNDRIQEQPLDVMPGLAEVLFVFDRLEQETHYSLHLQYQGQPVKLNGGNARLLSQKPCVLMVDQQLFLFQPDWDGKKFQPFFAREFVVVPKSAEKKYFQGFVLNAVRNFPVKASGFEVKRISHEPVPVLSLEKNWLGHWVFQLYFRYPGNVQFHAHDKAARGKTRFHDHDGEFSFTCVERQWESEKKFCEIINNSGLWGQGSAGYYLQDAGPASLENGHFARQETLWELVGWLGENQGRLQSAGFEFSQETGSDPYHLGAPELKMSVSEKTDWFDLYAVVLFGEHRIPFLRLKNFILQGRREFPLPDGTLGLIPPEWFEKYQDVFRFSSGQGETITLKKHHFPVLEQMEEQGLQVPDLSLAMERFVPPGVPDSLQARLRTYQFQGYRWLCFLQENKLGGCLADDMGLGKTIQTLALLARVHRPDNGNGTQAADHASLTHALQPPYQLDLFLQDSPPVLTHRPPASLIVMPLSLVHNWLQEIRKFAPTLRALQHTGPARATSLRAFSGYDLVLTTYGTVRNDVEFLSQYRFNYVILDESQVIKNAESKTFQAIKRLDAMHRLVLTGTPIENSLSDLWSQFSFINPGMLGSMSFFKEEFVQPVERNQDERQRVKLKKLIEPFILRRTKGEVAGELPPLTQVTRYCEMTEAHRSIYESRKSQVRNMILEQVEREGMDKSRFFILSSLMKLRMLANHPLLAEPDYEFDSGKFQVVRANLEKLLSEGHKVLIFSQFVKHLNIYRDYFEEQGLPYSLLTGQVPENERQVLIRKFQEDPERRVFLISLRAGGVGLNLTGADYVFILDPWWNPAVELQAINRAHRIGQDKKVFVYKFITRETVEEKILLLQQKKSDLAGMFIHSNNPLKQLDAEDLKALMD
jgi:superfamily II DNA or RNA helicase